VLVLISYPPHVIDQIRTAFKKVHHYPPPTKSETAGHFKAEDYGIPTDVLDEVEVILTFRLPVEWDDRQKLLPKLVWVQIASAGFDHIINHPLLTSPPPPGKPRIILSGASGIHSPPIGEHILGMAISLYHGFPAAVVTSRNEKRWGFSEAAGGRAMKGFQIKELRGRKMGVLGYGHIGREAARLGKAFGMKILACTSNGNAAVDNGYILPGTGDPDGSIPSEWFSSLKSDSFQSFLSQTDVLVITLPSTPSTLHIINSQTLAFLSPTSIVINIGRGPVISTPDLLTALNEKKIWGAGLDVTDPEPLPDGHPLFESDRIVLTSHMSGWTEVYPERVVELLMAQVGRVREGKSPYNVFDWDKGY